MNLWNHYVNNNFIPEIFCDASLDNAILLDKRIVKLGREISEKPKSLVLYGSTGRGKTYFSYCLFREFLNKYNYSVKFCRSKDLDDELQDAFRSSTPTSYVIKKYQEPKYLFIDDLGLEKDTDKVERDYYDILDYRWSNMMCTILSTNLTKKQLEKKFGKRINSRLKSFLWLEFTGKDLRSAV